jgi:O-acetyl-ADP-ribose deacetylase
MFLYDVRQGMPCLYETKRNETKKMPYLPPKITLTRGDITQVYADFIVNAANTSLLGGGGVDGAIHRAGGSKILEACQAIRARQGGCKVGEAVLTTAGNLPAMYVIHTVAPKWNGGEVKEMCLLANCYKNTLKLAEEIGAAMMAGDSSVITMAFPNIATGIYGFPKKLACAIAMATVRHFHTAVIKEVIFVCFDEENHQFYTEALANSNFDDFVKEDLLREMHEVFADAPFPKETIQQSELLDDYISSGEKWDNVAKEDAQYRHWSKVPNAVLAHCQCALSYMQPDGLLFYFPAYMRFVIEKWKADDSSGNAIDSTFFHLAYAPESKFSHFSIAQKQCIRHFLEYMDVFSYQRDAGEALEKYWKTP